MSEERGPGAAGDGVGGAGRARAAGAGERDPEHEIQLLYGRQSKLRDITQMDRSVHVYILIRHSARRGEFY